ncbi:MAG: RrF2 family transcriptional regulator, partial [Bacteroidota bacterium]
ILLLLKKSNILHSRKGKGGGYILARAPKKITIAEVLRVIDGPIAPLSCVSINFYQRCPDCHEKTCQVKKIMAATRDATLGVLEKRTVQDLSGD